MPEQKDSSQNKEEIEFYEEDIYEQKEKEEEKVLLVNFRLSNEWYGIEITKVKEVSMVGEITYLPSVPDYVLGIVNLRGNISAVVDLKKILGLEPEAIHERTRLIVTEVGKVQLTILVDEVFNVVEIPVSKIEPVLSTIEPEKAKYLKGECRLEDKLMVILDVDKLFAQ